MMAVEESWNADPGRFECDNPGPPWGTWIASRAPEAAAPVSQCPRADLRTKWEDMNVTDIESKYLQQIFLILSRPGSDALADRGSTDHDPAFEP